jgi:hypothetical protein
MVSVPDQCEPLLLRNDVPFLSTLGGAKYPALAVNRWNITSTLKLNGMRHI